MSSNTHHPHQQPGLIHLSTSSKSLPLCVCRPNLISSRFCPAACRISAGHSGKHYRSASGQSASFQVLVSKPGKGVCTCARSSVGLSSGIPTGTLWWVGFFWLPLWLNWIQIFLACFSRYPRTGAPCTASQCRIRPRSLHTKSLFPGLSRWQCSSTLQNGNSSGQLRQTTLCLCRQGSIWARFRI